MSDNTLEFKRRADELWSRWVTKSDTEDPEQWDDAFVSYTNGMEDLRMEFGHPLGKPRKRP